MVSEIISEISDIILGYNAKHAFQDYPQILIQRG